MNIEEIETRFCREARERLAERERQLGSLEARVHSLPGTADLRNEKQALSRSLELALAPFQKWHDLNRAILRAIQLAAVQVAAEMRRVQIDLRLLPLRRTWWRVRDFITFRVRE